MQGHLPVFDGPRPRGAAQTASMHFRFVFIGETEVRRRGVQKTIVFTMVLAQDLNLIRKNLSKMHAGGLRGSAAEGPIKN